MPAAQSHEGGGSARRTKRKVKVYRNGDTSDPIAYSYDSKRVTSFKKLLEELQKLPAFAHDESRYTRLYTIEGRSIKNTHTFEQAETNDFVLTGPEGFMRVKGGYQNLINQHSQQQQQQPHPQIQKALSADQLHYQEENAQHQQRPHSNRPRKPQAVHKEMTYDRMSYRDLNKQRYGDTRRMHEDRLENRVDIGTVKKIYLYRNGDPFYKPKLYIYRSKVHRKWTQFLEDLENLAPPVRGGGVRHLFTLKGKEVTSLEQLHDRRGYVVAGPDGYLEVKGGYEPIGKHPERSASALPELMPRPQTAAMPPTRNGRPETGHSGRPKTGQSDRPKTGQMGRPKTGQRGPGERLHERRLPEPTFFFVFKNGDGLEAKRFLFTPQQMEKGMPWLMEQVGKRFGIYANKLVTMDNREVTDARQFVNRGAYIIIPFGERFSESWHHFPEMAIDTSVFNKNKSNTNAELSRSQSGYGSGPQSSHPRSQSRLSRSQSVLASRRGSQTARYGSEIHEEGYESGREAYSDHEHRNQKSTASRGHQHHHGGDQHRQRSGSASSQCSFCDMLERHRQKHDLISLGEDQRHKQHGHPADDPHRVRHQFEPTVQDPHQAVPQFGPDHVQQRVRHQFEPADNVQRKRHQFDGTENDHVEHHEHPQKHHLYSNEDNDHQDILPPRPVTSRRVRLSPHQIDMPQDHDYPPMRSSSLNRILPQPSADDVHGALLHDGVRRGSTFNTNRQYPDADQLTRLPSLTRARSDGRINNDHGNYINYG